MLLAALAFGASSELTEEVTIRSRGGRAGPAVQAPPPRAAVAADEVIRSLDVYTKEPKPVTPKVTVSAGPRRLDKPFPEAPFLVFEPDRVDATYEHWLFEVLEGSEVVYKTEGYGELDRRIEWDGSGPGGEPAVRAGQGYHFRFTGKLGPQHFVLSSEPVLLKSFLFREVLGSARLEASNDALFQKGKDAFAKDSAGLLAALAARMRRARLGTRPYRFAHHTEQPESPLAKKRAARLKKHFSDALVVNPDLVEVDLFAAGRRGEATLIILPPEEGDTFQQP